MTEWEKQNNQYLAASLDWLRVRVQKFITDDGSPQPQPPAPQASTKTEPPPEAPAERQPGKLARWLNPTASKPAITAPAKPTLLLAEAASNPQIPPPSAKPAIDEAAAEKARAAAAQIDPPPSLVVLAQRLGLSDFERDTLLLCAAVEFDPGFPSLLARAQGAGRNYPTFGLALNIFDEAEWEALAAHSPLRRDRLIEINQPGATPLTSSALRADERIAGFLKGVNIIDDRLLTLLSPVDPAAAQVSVSQQATVENVLDRLRGSVTDSAIPVVQLTGADEGSNLAVAAQACATLRRQLFRVSTESIPAAVPEMETFARLWQRETLLLPVSLYIDASNLDSSSEAQANLIRLLSRGLGLAFLSVRETPVTIRVPNFPIDVRKPTPAEQFEAWQHLLGSEQGITPAESDAAAAMLAGQYKLNLENIGKGVALAAKASPAEGTIGDRAWAACRDLSAPGLDALAQKLDAKATWDDLVLPDEQTHLMQSIVGQVRERHTVYDDWGFAAKMNRGFGITALFAGESGTGKTMAAEVIANDLKLNLYRIDLSGVVSKYIGETEKNLRRLFDAAEQGGAILFFDEADALFGKRSEVKDSHDRYANIEINYLLQRMEAFSGLAILATNQKTALDQAFMRRLRFVVNFQFPGPKERKAIWQSALPETLPKRDLDFDRLAKLSVTGGNIHSIVLNAAFLAAQKPEPVTMQILMMAARMEMRKLEKPVSEAEFRA
jgi:ATPase family associated with various cellular activities (AAA)